MIFEGGGGCGGYDVDVVNGLVGMDNGVEDWVWTAKLFMAEGAQVQRERVT